MKHLVLCVIIVTSVVLVGTDLLWFELTSDMYQGAVEAVQCKEMKLKIGWGIAVYTAMVLGLAVFVVPRVLNFSMIDQSALNTLIAAAFYGGLFGLVVYIVFDFTVLLLFTDYTLRCALIDVLWGVVSCTFATFIGTLAGRGIAARLR